MTRIFGDEELELLATPLSIRLERAAKEQDAESVEEIRAQMDLECTAIFDKQSVWTAALQTFIVENVGEAAHSNALLRMSKEAFRPVLAEYEGLGFHERVVAIARHLRASGSTFWITDERDRLRFRLDPWGSARLWREPSDWTSAEQRRREGDRIVYRSQGAYASGRLQLLAEAGPLTHGRTGIPSFFAADIALFELRPIDLFGMPLAVITLPEGPGDSAYFDLYKDPRAIPAEAYECIGRSKSDARPAAVDDGPAFTELELALLGTPLSVQVEASVRSGDWDRLFEISRSMDGELVAAKDPLNLLNLGLLTWIARELGEDEAEQALAFAAEIVMGPAIDAVQHMDFADSIRQFTMIWRAHGSTFWIEETDETIVMRGRPMGACGRLWAHRYQPRIERISDSRVRYTTWGAYDPPASFYVMHEPHASSCGEPGMPLYSCHCHMFHEIYPIKRIGRPLWIEEHPLADNDGETVHVHYKDHNAWPAHYYRRVGLEKVDG